MEVKLNKMSQKSDNNTLKSELNKLADNLEKDINSESIQTQKNVLESAKALRNKINDIASKTDSKGNVVIAAKGQRAKNVITYNGTTWQDLNNNEWHVFTSANSEEDAKRYIIDNAVSLENGENPRILIKKLDDQFYQLGVGPFTLQTRQEMLGKLLKLQASLTNEYQLIKKEELEEIDKTAYYTLEEEDGWTIKKDGKVFVIEGKDIENLMRRINFSDYESLSYFHLMLKKMGIDNELRRMGIMEGNIVRIFDWEFEYEV